VQKVPAENEVSGGTRSSILSSSSFNNAKGTGTIDEEFTNDGKTFIRSETYFLNNVTGAKVIPAPGSGQP